MFFGAGRVLGRAISGEILSPSRGGVVRVKRGIATKQKHDRINFFIAGARYFAAAPAICARSKIGRKNSGSCAPATAYCRSKM